MDKFRLYCLLLSIALLTFACKKVTIHEPQSNAILPLAEGYSWTYVDSVFLTTTVPSIDTLISEITYTVGSEIFVEYGNESSTHLIRNYGWEIYSDNSELKPSIAIPFNGKIYGYTKGTLSTYDCTSPTVLVGEITYMDEMLQTGLFTGRSPTHISPLMDYNGTSIVYPATAGETIYSNPLFHDIYCLSFPIDGYHPNYPTVSIEPLVAGASMDTLTTPAGTFACIDYGSQFWSPNVGMIMAVHDGSGDYRDQNNVDQSYVVVWKRVLVGYAF